MQTNKCTHVHTHKYIQLHIVVGGGGGQLYGRPGHPSAFYIGGGHLIINNNMSFERQLWGAYKSRNWPWLGTHIKDLVPGITKPQHATALNIHQIYTIFRTTLQTCTYTWLIASHKDRPAPASIDYRTVDINRWCGCSYL